MTHEDRIERVAAAMANADADDGGNWYYDEDTDEPVFPKWEDLPPGLDQDVGGERHEWLIRGKGYYRRMARAAVAAMDADPSLDEMLDSIHPEAYIGDHRRIIAGTRRRPRYEWHVEVRWGGPTGPGGLDWARGVNVSHGTGPTRSAAIRAAVANAKEAE